MVHCNVERDEGKPTSRGVTRRALSVNQKQALNTAVLSSYAQRLVSLKRKKENKEIHFGVASAVVNIGIPRMGIPVAAKHRRGSLCEKSLREPISCAHMNSEQTSVL